MRIFFLLFLCLTMSVDSAFSADGDPIRLPESVKEKILSHYPWSSDYFQRFSQARVGQKVTVILQLKIPPQESFSEAYRLSGIAERYRLLKESLEKTSSLPLEAKARLDQALDRARSSLRQAVEKRNHDRSDPVVSAILRECEAFRSQYGSRFYYEPMLGGMLHVHGPIEAVISLLENDFVDPGIGEGGAVFYPLSCLDTLKNKDD